MDMLIILTWSHKTYTYQSIIVPYKYANYYLSFKNKTRDREMNQSVKIHGELRIPYELVSMLKNRTRF